MPHATGFPRKLKEDALVQITAAVHALAAITEPNADSVMNDVAGMHEMWFYPVCTSNNRFGCITSSFLVSNTLKRLKVHRS